MITRTFFLPGQKNRGASIQGCAQIRINTVYFTHIKIKQTNNVNIVIFITVAEERVTRTS